MSTNAFFNTPQNYSGTLTGALSFSNGDLASAGQNGNQNIDPQFIDLANGDLRLLSTSPMIDLGDPADADSSVDIEGLPRRQDGDLNLSPRVDIGAHEFSHVRLDVTSPVASGGVATITTTGTPGLTTFLFAGLGEAEFALNPFGTLLVNPVPVLQIFPWFPTASAVPVPIPANTPNLTLVLQILALNGAPGTAPGNTSNRAILEIAQ